MKKKILCLLLLTLPLTVHAAFSSNHTPSKIFGAGTIMFGVNDPKTTDTCDYFGRHFIFNATTESGKNILSILLAAKMANKNINVWYTPSKSPGTDSTTGCNERSIAIINRIGISD